MTRPATKAQPGHQAPKSQNLALFRIYVAYRSLLSLVLLFMLLSPNTSQIVGQLNPTLYITVALTYLATSIPLMGTLSARRQQNQKLLLLMFSADIIAITLLADSSGGMGSGLPILLVITSAASAVLLHNRTLAYLVAALAALAILVDTARLVFIDAQPLNALFPAGLLGLLIFAVSLLVQVIADRLGSVEELARNRGSDLYNLQRLNEQIVHHMRTGILLVNNEGAVRVVNSAASTLLAPGRPLAMEQGLQLTDYNPTLAQQYTHWQDTGGHKATPIKIADGAPAVIANFRELQASDSHDSLVFVEDYTPITQYAQSMKLTSLGRLTASIAHEIRNPLGAISHAAQLLQESPELEGPDRRMADIIVHHCARVNDIVESVMQISRKEAPRPERLTIASWLTEFVGAYLETLNRPADVTIDCDYRELQVDFDPENLARVITNLLDNALRHSKLATARETARIQVSVDFRNNQTLLDMIDIGAGVPSADQAKLFEPFFTTVAEGSGMGLYLCRELCEVNNADLSYRLTEQGESCFRIIFNQQPT